MDRPPTVLLVTHPAMEAHRAPGHPERPERLAAAAAGVERGAREAGARLERREASAADDATVERIHPQSHVADLERSCADGGGWLDPDTYLAMGSMGAARLAAGGTVEVALAVRRGEAAVAFAAVRPPGHHAGRGRASGFCLLNNVAVAAAALRSQGLERIAIVDWDVHHGDGTQAIFIADPLLCYASTHQSPLFPGTGGSDEVGIGAARGTKHNVPLPPGSGDEAFLAAWRERLLPEVERFGPEAILVSAGYDAALADPLAELEVTTVGYRSLGEELGALVARLGLPGVALTLEGGYDLPSLTDGVAATVAGLLAGIGPGDESRVYSTQGR